MKPISTKGIFFGILGIIIVFILAWIGGIAYINNSPGLYKYTVDIQGLENYEPSMITDIIVPMPQRDGKPVFNDDDVQYQTFGNWKSIIVVTRVGKMLAFQSVGRNLTSIHAEFYKKYPEGTVIQNITSESLSPVLPRVDSGYTQWLGEPDFDHDYSTLIYIPRTIRPLHSQGDSLVISLELIASEGLQHSISGKTYQVVVSERIPPGTYNSTPITVQVSERRSG